MTSIKKSIFYPTCSMEDKENYKQASRVERDGSIVERVFLDIPDPSERELIICLHYLRHMTRHFYKKESKVNILSRDSPWDFKIEINSKSTFNLEITSIADNPQQFITNKSEERLKTWQNKELIPLHELKKLNFLFPSIENDRVIEKHCNNAISTNELVPNPFFHNKTIILLSKAYEPIDSLDTIIRNIINKKIRKKHSEKEQTVLIIDNRTGAFDAPEYYEVVKDLSSFLESCPFSEIWFYTGYCSDNEGNNAEFSFSPMKVTNKQNEILYELSKEKTEDGRVIW